MKLSNIFLFFISALVKIVYDVVFYKIVGKKLIQEATNLVKTVKTLKSAEEECLRKCLLVNKCWSFNIFKDEEKLKCDLFNEVDGKFIEDEGYSHFSETAFLENIETTFKPKTTDTAMTGQVTVLRSHQLFTILKDTLCLKYNGKDDNLQWWLSSNCSSEVVTVSFSILALNLIL